MTAVQQIPDTLIYEMDNGKPIYYAGYRDVLNGKLSAEAIMGSSILQSLIVTELIKFLGNLLPANYMLLSNEIGILFSKGNWRLADIAIIEKSRITTIDDQYIKIPPNTVIEIDTKAALEDYEHPQNYYTQKTQSYLNFGVDKVVWMYTKSRTIEVSTKADKHHFTWEDDIVFLNDLSFNLASLMQEYLG